MVVYSLLETSVLDLYIPLQDNLVVEEVRPSLPRLIQHLNHTPGFSDLYIPTYTTNYDDYRMVELADNYCHLSFTHWKKNRS